MPNTSPPTLVISTFQTHENEQYFIKWLVCLPSKSKLVLSTYLTTKKSVCLYITEKLIANQPYQSHLCERLSTLWLTNSSRCMQTKERKPRCKILQKKFRLAGLLEFRVFSRSDSPSSTIVNTFWLLCLSSTLPSYYFLPKGSKVWLGTTIVPGKLTSRSHKADFNPVLEIRASDPSGHSSCPATLTGSVWPCDLNQSDWIDT